VRTVATKTLFVMYLSENFPANAGKVSGQELLSSIYSKTSETKGCDIVCSGRYDRYFGGSCSLNIQDRIMIPIIEQAGYSETLVRICQNVSCHIL